MIGVIIKATKMYSRKRLYTSHYFIFTPWKQILRSRYSQISSHLSAGSSGTAAGAVGAIRSDTGGIWVAALLFSARFILSLTP